MHCCRAELVKSSTLGSPQTQSVQIYSVVGGRFMAVEYQQWAFDTASAEESRIIQFVAKKRIKMLIQLRPNNPLK